MCNIITPHKPCADVLNHLSSIESHFRGVFLSKLIRANKLKAQTIPVDKININNLRTLSAKSDKTTSTRNYIITPHYGQINQY